MQEQSSLHEPTKHKVWTLAELNTEQVKSEHKWIIIKDSVYDMKTWMSRHPGGDLAIFHCLYQDATIQFTRFHPPNTERFLPTYFIGTLDEQDSKGLVSHSPLNQEFLKLDQELREKGFFDYETNFYFRELLKCLFFFVLTWVAVLYATPSLFNSLLAAFFLSVCWHQLAFVGHDAGHNGVTGVKSNDDVLGVFVGNFVGGISIGWWKDSHNVHHIITNDPEHDPDIQHLPFMAVTTRFFNNVFSTYHKRELKFDKASRVLVGIQHYTYYVIMMLARFNLYVQGIIFVAGNRRCQHRVFETIGLILFFCWFCPLVGCIQGLANKIVFVLCSHAMAGLLHVQITISHFSMATEKTNEQEEFIKHQMRTTMDVECPEWLDWLHGGLQFQVIHHLFPRMPRKNLRRARDELLKLCKKYDIEYKSYNFINGNITVINHLKMISEKIK